MADQMRGEQKPPAANFATTTSSSASATVAATNFEYDNETEWDVGIGDLIIDLDADIEKTTSTPPTTASTPLPPSLSSLKTQLPTLPLSKQGGISAGSGTPSVLTHAPPNTMAVEHSATVDKGLKMKIKRTQKPSGNKQHEIVKSGAAGVASSGSSTSSSTATNSNASSGSVENGSESAGGPGGSSAAATGVASASAPAASHQNKKQVGPGPVPPTTTATHRKGDKKSSTSGAAGAPAGPPSSSYLPSPLCDELLVGGANTPGPPAPAAHLNSVHSAQGPLPSSSSSSGILNNNSSSSAVTSSANLSLSDLHDIRHKIKTEQKETADVCIGTSVGTITEPECLGPCEPGTSVTLEGIVWHETEGVLVVNVTWRGKTYVGTLLDCTRHDWAPPRFCDSPTSDLDARTTKNSSGAGGAGGRSSKRGRSATAAASGALSSGGSQSGSSGTGGSSSNGNSNGSGSGKDAKTQRRTTNNSNSSGITVDKGTSGTSSPTPFVLPRPDKRKASTGSSKEDTVVATSSSGGSDSKKSRLSASLASPPPPPALLECPDPNCSKKYKHINGLRYHQNHAHGGMGSAEEESSTTSSTVQGEAESGEGEDTGAVLSHPTADGSGDTMRLPGDSASGVVHSPSLGGAAPVSVPPGPPSVAPPLPASVAVPPSSSASTPSSGGFKIKSPASLLTDVHSLDNQNMSQQMDLSASSNSAGVLSSSSSTSSHNKKKRKHDDEEEDKCASTGGPGSVLDSATGAVSSAGAGLHQGPRGEEPSSPAYSDISDDETRGPAGGRYPPPGDVLAGGPVGPYSAYPVGPVPTGLPTGAGSLMTDKLLEKDHLKSSGVGPPNGEPLGSSPLPPNAGLTQPPPGIYYPYSFPPGYPYGNVPPPPNNSSPLPPVGPGLGAGPPPQQAQQDARNLSSSSAVPHEKPLGGADHASGGDKGAGGNENHQILKESHEVKAQVLLPGTYGAARQAAGTESNRFYLYNAPGQQDSPGSGRPRSKDTASSHSSPGGGKSSLKDIKKERDSDQDGKDQGVKPTMETQGPPPAPTSQQYAYIHAGYLAAAAAGAPYNFATNPDPSSPGPPPPHHPLYRGGPPLHHLLPMHHQMMSPHHHHHGMHPHHARYPPGHAPEDLSTPSSEQKGLDMYYQAAAAQQQHKIHELQERALKSPNSAKPGGPQSHPGSGPPNSGPRGPSPGGTPGAGTPGSDQQRGNVPLSMGGPNRSGSPAGGPGLGKEAGRNSNSPPPQRHVHTHHHTHVGLGYSILAGQYPAPYGAAAVQAVINQYPPTTK